MKSHNSQIDYCNSQEQLHWLPISACIEYKFLLLILKAQLEVAPKYI